ncbi:MAG: glycoside hydrolase family 57 protein, partial [Solirubrobacteraceae bacterium]
MSDRGELAIVLHTHMPYVEGFGTWPFGEEWLWEAMATCYLPLLALLRSDAGASLTLSLTPVLCDQLEVPDLAERFQRFVDEVRTNTHREDARGLRAAGHARAAAELERALGLYLEAAQRLGELDGDLLSAVLAHARLTSSATHAVLPLVATDALLRAQVRGGVRSHLARLRGQRPGVCAGRPCEHPPGAREGGPSGAEPGLRVRAAGAAWGGGFWLPECAHAPHLDQLLAAEGVRITCLELTERFGVGSPAHLRPLRSP